MAKEKAFVGKMLQDIYPHKIDNHYYPDMVADEKSYVFIFRGSDREKEVLLFEDQDENQAIPSLSDIVEQLKIDMDNTDELIYLFKIDEEKYFLFPYYEKEISLKEGTWTKVLNARKEGKLQDHQVFALFTAYHLSEWYESSRFCGKCGAATKKDGAERAMVCTKCGHKIYPRINPAVIIGVTDKETNKLILTKYRTGFAQNALVAGFAEIGESLEETVKREVMEEVGLEVDNVRYYKSQPWGIASDILSGFFCDVVGAKEIKMDVSELKYAQWVAPEDIELQTPGYSLTNEMMKLFKEQGYEGTKMQ